VNFLFLLVIKPWVSHGLDKNPTSKLECRNNIEQWKRNTGPFINEQPASPSFKLVIDNNDHGYKEFTAKP
jgi:hypothetical protein